MSLADRLFSEQQRAMKEGDKLRLSTLRLLRAMIKNREVEKGRPLDDVEVIQAISSSCKQRREAIAQYRQGRREDLAQKEESELMILEEFLPPSYRRKSFSARLSKPSEQRRLPPSKTWARSWPT